MQTVDTKLIWPTTAVVKLELATAVYLDVRFHNLRPIHGGRLTLSVQQKSTQ